MLFTDTHEDHEDSANGAEMKAQAASRSTWVSVAVNVCLSVTQIAVGVFAKSQGLIADGIHSLSDLIADFVVLFANHHSKKDADLDHPYGHQRFETAASLALGALLLAVGLGMLWSALMKLADPGKIAQVHVAALWVAAIALVAKESLFRYMLAIAKKVKSSMLVANAWHARSDAASSLVVGLGIIGNMASLVSANFYPLKIQVKWADSADTHLRSPGWFVFGPHFATFPALPSGHSISAMGRYGELSNGPYAQVTSTHRSWDGGSAEAALARCPGSWSFSELDIVSVSA